MAENNIHSCQQCPRVFATRGGLWRHVATHNRIQPQRGDGGNEHLDDGHIAARRGNEAREIVSVWDEAPVSGNESLDEILRVHWRAMKTGCTRGNVRDILNFRLWDLPDVGQDYDPGIVNMLAHYWRTSRCSLKVNCSVGAILVHKITGEFKYFHSSTNNAAVFDIPVIIREENQLLEFYETFRNVDIDQQALERRPNTVWKLYRITNVSFVAYKLVDVARIGNGVDLPSFVSRSYHIISLTKQQPDYHKPYDDNLCFFRCLALFIKCTCIQDKCTCTKPDEALTIDLFKKFAHSQAIRRTYATFSGITESHLLSLEEIFDIPIVVMELMEKDIAQCVWVSGRNGSRKLYLNKFGRHFSYIRNINGYSGSYQCDKCEFITKRSYNLSIHKCEVSNISNLIFKAGQFTPRLHIFAEIEREFNITIPEELRYSRFRATYDIECFLPKDNLPINTAKLEYTSRHEFLSVSTCSNVPGFTSPVCFVRDKTNTTQEVIDTFVTYLNVVSETASELIFSEFSRFFDKLETLVAEREKKEESYSDHDISAPGVHARRSGYNKIVERLVKHIKLLPVVGFNSQKYDLNILKPFLVKSLFAIRADKVRECRAKQQEEKGNVSFDEINSHEDDSDEEDSQPRKKKRKKHTAKYSDSDGYKAIGFAVQRMNALACLQTDELNWIDVLNFLAPGFSYAQYLKAYGCIAAKGFFPYEWVDSLDKLDFTELPPQESFYSSLNDEGISDENYKICQSAWIDEGMETFKDFLVWYNNLDVTPFLDALAKQCDTYRFNGIDMLKEAISLPGLAVSWLFRHSRQHFNPPYEKLSVKVNLNDLFESICNRLRDNLGISLIDFRNKDIYDLLFDNIVGGPSIVFCRKQISNETILRETEDGTQLCRKILGVDANALYLWSICQDMPTGYPKRWKIEESSDLKFVSPSHLSRASVGWLEYQSAKRREFIHHRLNEGEHRIGQHSIPVDGMCFKSNTVYQFHGCYWHGHCCGLDKGKEQDMHPQKEVTFEILREETKLKDDYILSLGYNLVTIWECEWNDFKKQDPQCSTFVKAVDDVLFAGQRRISQQKAVENIVSGVFYGFVECDIHVPIHLKEKFAEMSPIFKNVEVSRDHLSPCMLDFAKENDFLLRPQRMLIGSDRGEKILLLSDLAKWYLAHGLEITKIYQLIEYTPRRLFDAFGDSISETRRKGDTDSSQEINAAIAKLIGNATFGKTITRKEKFRDHSYSTCIKRVSDKIRNKRFFSMKDIGEGVYELSEFKKTVSVQNSYNFDCS